MGALQSIQLSQWVRCYSAKFATVGALLFRKVCNCGCAVILQSMLLWVRCYSAKYAAVGAMLFRKVCNCWCAAILHESNLAKLVIEAIQARARAANFK